MKGASGTSAGSGRQSDLCGRMKLITAAVSNPVKLRIRSEQRLRHMLCAADSYRYEKSAIECERSAEEGYVFGSVFVQGYSFG